MSMGMKMEYNAEVERGWPNEGALHRAETIAAGQSLSNGDWVTKTSDNSVTLAGATKTSAAGLVVRGNADSGSAAYSGKAVVIWGNAIVRMKNLPNGVTFTPGASVCVQNGKIQLATGTDPVLGIVLDVVSLSAVNDANIVIKFN